MTDRYGNPGDEELRALLTSVVSVAVIGASERPERDSHRVATYLDRAGYRVHAVNPNLEGRPLLGRPSYPALAAVPSPVELVDVFRRREAIPGVVDQVLPLVPDLGIRCVWLQRGLADETAAARAREAGLLVVMDRCLMAEHRRLVGKRAQAATTSSNT